MSHISKIEVEIHSLEYLKAACEKLGLQFVENQKTFRCYERRVVNRASADRMMPEEIGKCDHAICVPGCRYEIGIIYRDNRYLLFWDNWHVGGLESKIGKNAGLLKQAYTIESIRREARLKGYLITEIKIKQGIRLMLTA